MRCASRLLVLTQLSEPTAFPWLSGSKHLKSLLFIKNEGQLTPQVQSVPSRTFAKADIMGDALASKTSDLQTEKAVVLPRQALV